MATNLFIPFWPSLRLFALETPATTPLKNPHWYRSCPTPRPLKVARSLTKKPGERWKSINIWINHRTRVEKWPALPLPLALIIGLRKTCSKSRASTIKRKSTTRRTALSPEKTCQKTNINHSNLRLDNWH